MPRNLNLPTRNKKEYETIEDDISAMEERMDAIDEEMGKCARDFVKLNELTKEKTELETAIEEKDGTMGISGGTCC